MRKIFCIILIVVLLSYSICTNAENSEKVTVSEKGNTLDELQKQAEEINNQILENSKKMELVEEELSQNLLQIQEIEEKIQLSEQQLNEINKEVEILDKDIQTTEEQLEIKQIQYEKINKQAEQILVGMYISGDTQYLDVLVGSNSIVDFISNYFLLSELLEYNVALIEKAVEQKKEVEEIMFQLEEKKEEVLLKKKEQQKTSQVLENTKTSKQYYTNQLTEEERKIQEEINEYKIQMAAVEVEIKKIAGIKSFGEEYIGETMIWPIPGKTNITSQYGMRTHPITGIYSLHKGVDVSAPIGTDFVAMASGVVTKAEYNKYYGNMVIIDHGGGVQTLYAHGSEIVAKLGDLIAQGDTVLKVGSTGYSTGPHAHFEIRIDGETVNPLDYVKSE